MAKQAVDQDPTDYYNQWTYALVCHAAAGAASKPATRLWRSS